MAILQSIPTWQVLTFLSILSLLFLARVSLLTLRIRATLRPLISRHVEQGVPTILRVQQIQHPFLDALFALVSILVSVEFYTTFLPFLFWTGHLRLARQMTLLMAFCIYIGNCIKDAISAPRPPSPPVRRLTATESERGFALEYGLPSSHTINTICLSGYLLLYIVERFDVASTLSYSIALLFLVLVFLTGFGRLYLGMHTPVDILGGGVIGFILLAFWCSIDDYLDSFITNGSNVLSFWASITFLLLFAYPTPEQPTPSFESHTAFNGVAWGVVLGIHRTYWEYHHENMGSLIGTQLGMNQIGKRLVIGLPLIITVKLVSKELAKRLVPAVCSVLGIPIKSSSYIPTLQGLEASVQMGKTGGLNNEVFLSSRKFNSVSRPFIATLEEPFDVDTGIRLLQYAGLGWSVVELVPCFFQFAGL